MDPCHNGQCKQYPHTHTLYSSDDPLLSYPRTQLPMHKLALHRPTSFSLSIPLPLLLFSLFLTPLLSPHFLLIPLSPSPFPYQVGTTNTLNSISAASTTVAMVAGVTGPLLRTTNGGVTWTDTSPGFDKNVLSYLQVSQTE